MKSSEKTAFNVGLNQHILKISNFIFLPACFAYQNESIEDFCEIVRESI